MLGQGNGQSHPCFGSALSPCPPEDQGASGLQAGCGEPGLGHLIPNPGSAAHWPRLGVRPVLVRALSLVSQDLGQEFSSPPCSPPAQGICSEGEVRPPEGMLESQQLISKN